MMKLNIGCGYDYRKDWVNLDILGNLKADVKHDINKFPYPFKENTFDEVDMQMVLEHYDNPIAGLREVIRISKDKAKLRVVVPHAFAYSQVSDIQHKTFFTEHSFNDVLLQEYDLKQLRLVSHTFLFNNNKWKKYIPFKRFLKIYLNGIYDDMEFIFEINKVKKQSK